MSEGLLSNSPNGPLAVPLLLQPDAICRRSSRNFAAPNPETSLYAAAGPLSRLTALRM
jgi:hypothetical protein